jgi:deoxyribose-phosphate aldolase
VLLDLRYRDALEEMNNKSLVILISAASRLFRQIKLQGITDAEIDRLVVSVDYSEALTLTAGESDVRAACRDARRYGFRAVVAFPQYLRILVDELKGSNVRAQIPVGFPCGGSTTHVKCIEAEEGLKQGATDLDMMMNLSAFKSGYYKQVAEDITAVLAVAKPFGVPFKVIIEVGALTDAEIAAAAKLVADTGADFVKTCTGFGPGRVTLHAIRIIKEAVGDRIGIKASGDVASLEDGVAFMRAGATVVAMRKHLVTQLDHLRWRAR